MVIGALAAIATDDVAAAKKGKLERSDCMNRMLGNQVWWVAPPAQG